MTVKNLDKLFSPRRVAVMGADPAEAGIEQAVLRNLLNGGYQGVIYPVIPQRESAGGIQCYANALMLPHGADLAVVCRPAAQVPAAVRECAMAGITGVLVLSTADGGPDAQPLAELRQIAGDFPELRIIGPRSLGLINTSIGLNASLSPVMPRPGQAERKQADRHEPAGDIEEPMHQDTSQVRRSRDQNPAAGTNGGAISPLPFSTW